MKPETISIDGTDYVRKDSTGNVAAPIDGMPFVMIRTYSAGVFFGYLESRTGKEVKLRKAKRVFYWSGAASLSQLAQEGTTKPNDCKFCVELPSIELMEAIEVIPISEKAATILNSVKTWKM